MAARKSTRTPARKSGEKSLSVSQSHKGRVVTGKVSKKSERVMRETTDRFHKALSRLADR